MSRCCANGSRADPDPAGGTRDAPLEHTGPAADIPSRRAGRTAQALRWRELAGLLGAVLLALAAISVGYGFHYDFVCRDVFPAALCRGLSLAVPRGLCVMALAGLVLGLRPGLRAGLAAGLRPHVAGRGLLLAALGLGLILLPLGHLLALGAVPAPALMLGAWLAGLVLAPSGLALALADPARLRAALSRRDAAVLVAATLPGLLLPDLVLQMQGAWSVDAVAAITFAGVVTMLHLLGQPVHADPETAALAYDTFAVLVGPPCSGVEGFALLTVFTAVFLILFRDRLRMGRAWILLPVAIGLSWILNMVRITVLMLIGRYVSVDLAVGGFHSHAGWIVFLTLALLLAWTAHGIRWFRRAETGPGAVTAGAATATDRGPFFADPVVMLILPFAVFMLGATLTSAAAEVPGLLYPLRIAAVAAVLWLGRRGLAALFDRAALRPDPLAMAAGTVCGGLWLLTAPPAEAGDVALRAALEALPPLLAGVWVLCRVAGTVLLVPLLEEGFFRGYVQARIGGAGRAATPLRHWAGLVVAALLFAALHDRVVAAALAGALFGLIYLRRGRLSDAVQAHAAANAVIAVAAMTAGDWHLI